MMEWTHGTCGGNRRRFLKTTAATGAAIASADGLLTMAADAPARSTIPLVTLGKTGQKVTRLGMGSTISGLDRRHVQNDLFAGGRYIETAESYENKKDETVSGGDVERTK